MAESAAAHAAIIQAIKASGAIVRVEPEEFQVFYTKTRQPLMLPGRAEVVEAKAIWVPR